MWGRPSVCKAQGHVTSAIRALPTMTSGMPRVNSRTLCLTQSAALSLAANAASELSKMLRVMSTSRQPSSDSNWG